jgi:ribonuclease Z
MSMSNDFRVTLLGTGTPIPRPDRFGPSTLVEAGNQKLLVDAGRGATIRLTQLGIPIGSLDALLLTHYHFDHTCGVPDVWLTGWLESHFGTRTTPFRVIGPTGAATLMQGLQQAYALDIAIRIADEKLPLSGIDVQVSEYDHDGVVYDVDGLKVTAFEVDHGDAIKPCYGYRFDYDGRAAVLSGDTRFNENVIKHAHGVDLLVHEVAAASPELMKRAYIQRIIAHHTVPQAVGVVFSRTRPKLAAYTHLVYLGKDSKDETVAPIDLNMLEAQTRETYDGPLVLGEDLMTFDLGETVRVTRWPRLLSASSRRPASPRMTARDELDAES